MVSNKYDQGFTLKEHVLLALCDSLHPYACMGRAF